MCFQNKIMRHYKLNKGRRVIYIMIPIKIQCESYEQVMRTTNAFVLTNILPKYNNIKITTYYDSNDNLWISEVSYNVSN